MTPHPEARLTSDATLAQLRAWHESRFAPQSVKERPLSLIVASGPAGKTILMDPETGEIVEDAFGGLAKEDKAVRR